MNMVELITSELMQIYGILRHGLHKKAKKLKWKGENRKTSDKGVVKFFFVPIADLPKNHTSVTTDTNILNDGVSNQNKVVTKI